MLLPNNQRQHLAHPEGCAALRIVLVTVPRVSRFCEHFPDGSDLHPPHQGKQQPEEAHTPDQMEPQGLKPFHMHTWCAKSPPPPVATGWMTAIWV